LKEKIKGRLTTRARNSKRLPAIITCAHRALRRKTSSA
jgi:hypothetical protein